MTILDLSVRLPQTTPQAPRLLVLALHSPVVGPTIVWTQPAHTEQHDRDGEEAAVDAEMALPADQQSPEVAQPGEAPFDGLLTNDKFCVTRTAVLPLTWSRRPLRLRTGSLLSVVSLQSHESVQVAGGETDEGEAHQRMEHPTPNELAQRRSDPMGSGLSAPAAVDNHQSRGSQSL